jgi:hypothetical protein
MIFVQACLSRREHPIRQYTHDFRICQVDGEMRLRSGLGEVDGMRVSGAEV